MRSWRQASKSVGSLKRWKTRYKLGNHLGQERAASVDDSIFGRGVVAKGAPTRRGRERPSSGLVLCLHLLALLPCRRPAAIGPALQWARRLGQAKKERKKERKKEWKKKNRNRGRTECGPLGSGGHLASLGFPFFSFVIVLLFFLNFFSHFPFFVSFFWLLELKIFLSLSLSLSLSFPSLLLFFFFPCVTNWYGGHQVESSSSSNLTSADCFLSSLPIEKWLFSFSRYVVSHWPRFLLW